MAAQRDSRNREREGFSVDTRLDLLEQDMDKAEGKVDRIVARITGLIFAVVGAGVVLAANVVLQLIVRG